ncbi:hypothetical protein AB0H88_26415 [Nonomuraea sp. NPDC050680]|uniref:hypothetical protein n=1 Tax=Nonomuraea sp. NPDC050680 TaxID=3154630 RepID=UPI0034112C32
MISREGGLLGLRAAHRLAELGCCEIEPGLSEAEFDRIERDFGFEFADDHRAFLAAGLPVGQEPQPGTTWEKLWPDWRNCVPDRLREQLAWPVDGILFDVEHNAFWHNTWGDRPDDLTAALTVARSQLAQVPTLVPIFGHRYLPAGHSTHGHPVLSVYQTDIVFYGTDLADYITNEFSGTGQSISEDWITPPLVRFWGDFL